MALPLETKDLILHPIYNCYSLGGRHQKNFIVYIHMYLILPVYLFFCVLKSATFLFSHICLVLTNCMTEFSPTYPFLFSQPTYSGGTSSATASSSRGYFCSHCILGGGFLFLFSLSFFSLWSFFFVLWCAVACGKYPLFYYFELRIDTYGVRRPRGSSRKPMLFLSLLSFFFFSLSLPFVLLLKRERSRDRRKKKKKKTFYKQQKLYRSILVGLGARWSAQLHFFFLLPLSFHRS